MQPLRQRLQPLDALWTFKKCGCPRDHQVQARKSTGIDLVDELAQRVEALVTDVAPNPLNRLDLVEDDEHPDVPRIAQDRQNSLQEIERTEVINVPFQTRRIAWLPPPRWADPRARRAVPRRSLAGRRFEPADNLVTPR